MEQIIEYFLSWLLDILLKEYYQHIGDCTGFYHLNMDFEFRDKFFLNLDFSHDAFESNKVKKFHDLYGREIIGKYRKTVPTDSKYQNAPTFKEFIDYLLNLPLKRLDSHWLPTYFQCMPCHIKYSILGK